MARTFPNALLRRAGADYRGECRATAAAIPGAWIVLVERMGRNLSPSAWPVMIDALMDSIIAASDAR
jgi:hypothetical protein